MERLEKFVDFRVLFVFEALFGILIIQFRAYTEVDWEAYMAQSKGFLYGDYDYMNLKGPSGPLVYPAGFLYIFSVFYYLCFEGTSIRAGQYLFLAIYLMNLKIMHLIYKKIEPHVGKFPIVLCCLSFKMHSTYLLRLFNDPVAILFMNWCILSAMNNQWKTSVLLYSVALSIKMNILLYLPGLLLVLNWAGNYVYTLLALCFIIAFQLSIAIPFLITNSKGYFTMAFDFSRIFDQKESAYWQFFPNEIFISRVFHTSLLVLHVIFLLIFLFTKAATGKTLKEKMKSLNLPTSFAGLLRPDQGCSIDPHIVAYAMFTTHFIGIIFARAFHIQYYTWYMFSVPFILCYQSRSIWKYSLFLLLEIAYKQYPPRLYTSCMVLVLHILFTVILFKSVSKITPLAHVENSKTTGKSIKTS